MKRFRAIAAFALAALAAGCGTELRYAPATPVYAFPAGRLGPVAKVDFKDESGGVSYDGDALILKRPFFETFQDAVRAQLAALKLPVSAADGATLEIALTKAALKRGRGVRADLSGSVACRVSVRRPGQAECRREASGWSSLREGFASSPGGIALETALSKAVDNLGPTLAASCLFEPDGGAATAPALPRDPRGAAVVVGVRRRRGEPAAEEAEARTARDFAARGLRVPDDRALLIVDEMATLADVRKSIERWLPDHVAPDGRVFVYFAGHGAEDPKTGLVYLLPFDGDADALPETGLSLEQLYADLGRLPARVSVVLGAGVPPDHIGKRPENVRVIAAAADPSTALDAVKADWGAP